MITKSTSLLRQSAFTLLFAVPVVAFAQAGAARLADSEKDAVYDCAIPPLTAAAAKAAELGMAQWDKNKMGCAADIWYSLAERAPADTMLQVQALLASTSYIDQVNILAGLDAYGVHQPEFTARILHAVEHGKALEARLAAVPAEDATVLAARALYRLTWPAKVADAKAQIAESRAAMQLFEKAVAIDPKALDGNALWILGRLYYDLPEFAGGDPVKGQMLLERAYRNTPHNIALLRYSAYVFVQERDIKSARGRLIEILALQADPAGLQPMSDELKQASELATRIGETALAEQLISKRKSLLKANPQLLLRLVPAINLHGGVDPMTGKDY